MKKFLLFIGIISTTGLMLVGFNNTEQHSDIRGLHELSNKEDILRGTNEVITTTEELKELIESDENNSTEINQLGEEIEKRWDRIEKKVEMDYPEDYTHIEESLYPLIAMAKRETPNKKQLHEFSNETLEKLENFNKKIN
ncbi:hypothetical protein [Virgibacillus litoralis]|uniref:Uncharacterized protein n=1 Tax=Virgibacillus litoralis TaxID=578221 RepID=A0ABS4HFW5_9BACI|nr:hypothetical protein [Virgibacillus litoralis]MBP1949758.1 hypothetical protein [Virgibacillus litoralis]